MSWGLCCSDLRQWRQLWMSTKALLPVELWCCAGWLGSQRFQEQGGFTPDKPWAKGEFSLAWAERLLTSPAAAHLKDSETCVMSPACFKNTLSLCVGECAFRVVIKEASGAPASPGHSHLIKGSTGGRKSLCRPNRSCRRCWESLHWSAWGRTGSRPCTTQRWLLAPTPQEWAHTPKQWACKSQALSVKTQNTRVFLSSDLYFLWRFQQTLRQGWPWREYHSRTQRDPVRRASDNGPSSLKGYGHSSLAWLVLLDITPAWGTSHFHPIGVINKAGRYWAQPNGACCHGCISVVSGWSVGRAPKSLTTAPN